MKELLAQASKFGIVGILNTTLGLAVIFALLAFGHLFGFVGVLIALPVSALILVALRRARGAYLRSRLYLG